MRALARGCLGVALVPLAAGLAVAAIGALGAPDPIAQGVGAAAALGSLAGLVLAARLVHGGLRTAALGPVAAPGPAARSKAPGGVAGPLAAWLLVVLTGSLVASAGGPGRAALVPLHIAAALLPARILTRYVAARLGRPGRGRIGRAMAWGALGATTLAALGETFVGLVLALAVWLALGVAPGARDALWAALAPLVDAARSGDPAGIESAFNAAAGAILRPSIVAAAFGLLGLAGPLIEELAKLAGVAALRPATRRGAFSLGMASGAGFGVVEALLTGAAALGPGWSAAMAARAVATAMHAATCGVAALGWHDLVRAHDARRGVAHIALAVALHGAWNTGVLVAVASGAALAAGVGPPTAAAGVLAGPALVTAVFAAILLGLPPTLARLAREAEPATGTDGAA